MAPDTNTHERRSKQRPRPSVLAVVVAHEPGAWFAECLASLEAQSYDRFGVLVVLSGDEATFAAAEQTIAAQLDKVQVVRAPGAKGFGAAVQAGLDAFQQKASMLLLCHDDVALNPRSVQILVNESIRSQAGVVGPKLVDWDEPRVIQSVGFATDKFATPVPLAEQGDLDQEQYDGVADVFSVASSCLLIRADLYETIGGYDAGMSFYGDDLDLCWRAQAAGARVVVVPNAVARHRGVLDERLGNDADQRLKSRHRLRTVLSGYGGFRTARVIPQAILLTLMQAVAALVTGRVGRLRALFGAWTWNLARFGPIMRRRKDLAEFRQLSDGDFRELQRGGSFWLSQAIAARIGSDQRDSAAALSESLRKSSVRVPALAAGVLGVVFLFGSRQLITSDIAAVGQLARFDSSPGDLLGEWWSGWWSTGLGTDDSPPFGYALLAMVGYLFLGAMGVLRKLVILAAIPVGVFGAFSVFRSSGSLWARVATATVYLSIPVGFNSLSEGSWYGLLGYAAAPWLALHLGRAHGSAPFRVAQSGTRPTAQILRLGLFLGVVGAFVPPIWIVAAVMLGGLVVGALLAGSLQGTARMVSIFVPAAGIGLALNLPWFLGVTLPRSQWAPVVAAGSSDVGALSLRQILLFDTGQFQMAGLLVALTASAAFVLIIGRSWRLVWGIRAWGVALGAWGLVWVGEYGLLPLPLPAAELLLPVAAVGIAMACGLGVIAFETDLQLHNFGWRQILTVVAALGIAVGAVPLVANATDGRWNMARADIDAQLSFFDTVVTEEQFAAGINQPPEGAYRVLWVGDPRVLPGAGVPLDDEMAFFTTDSGGVDITDQWVGRVDGATRLIRQAIEAAVDGDSSRLGYDLAPLGIRYVVVVERSAPAPFADEVFEVPERLDAAFAAQLDVRRISTVNRAVQVYENDAFFPARADGLVIDSTQPRPQNPVLLERTGFATFAGRVESDHVVYVAAAPTGRWRLEVGGVAASSETAFGWATSFRPETGGDAVLTYERSPLSLVVRLLQVGGWLVVIALLLLFRSRAERELARSAPTNQIEVAA